MAVTSWEFEKIAGLSRTFASESLTFDEAWSVAESVITSGRATEATLKLADDSRIISKLFITRPQAALVPYNSAVADAATLWQEYATAGEQISAISNGAQSTAAIAKSTGPTSLVKTTSGTFKPASLLALELPTAAAAIAPVLGVAVGFDLYNKNPEAWETISRALLPFCYDDSQKVPGFVEFTEAAGEIIATVLLGKEIVDAVKDALQESDVIKSDGSLNGLDGYVYEGEFYEGHSGGTYSTPWADEFLAPSARPSYVVVQEGLVANLGETCEVWNTTGTAKYVDFKRSNGSGWGSIYCPPYSYTTRTMHPVGPAVSYTYDNMPDDKKNAYDAFRYGERETILPEGFSQWGDVPYYPSYQPGTQIASGVDSSGNPTFSDAVPVPLPVPLTPEQSLTEPFPYPSQSTEPVPWPQPQPFDKIEPYRLPDEIIDSVPWPRTDVDPWPEPEPDPVPQPRPDSDPENPSQPQPVGPDITPPDPPPPSGGDSGPTPLGPDILPPFGDGTDPDGLIAVYNPPVQTLRNFAKWLWVTWPQAGLDKIWNNPFDGVISLFELYCTPPVNGARNIRSGFLDSGINSPTIDRYTTINCGSLIVPEYWNNYLDYAPYTQVSIYLPFIGIVNVDANDIVGHSVNITYNIDCYNGSCIAMITVAKAGPDGEIYNCLAYQFSGNCAVDVPLSGGSQAAIKGAIINASAVGIGGLIMGAANMASGKLLSGASDMIVAAEHALSNVMSARSSVQKSGSFGASFGAMGAKIPYIMVKRPVQVVVRNYNELYGYQAHKAVTIGQCRGYIRCREVHVESPTASDAEKNLIAQMLKDGVWI